MTEEQCLIVNMAMANPKAINTRNLKAQRESLQEHAKTHLIGKNESRQGKKLSFHCSFITLLVVALVIVVALLMSVSSPANSQTDATQNLRYVDFGGAFNGSLPLFDFRVVKGYNDDKAALKSDLTNAVRYYLNDLVRRNTGDNHKAHVSDNFEKRKTTAESGPKTDYSERVAADSSTSTLGDDFQSFEIYISETIKEADVVESNGSIVFAVYGDYIVMWDAKRGTDLGKTRLPKVEKVDETLSPSSSNESSFEYDYYSIPSISALLIYKNRLVVIVQGYAGAHIKSLGFYPVMSSYRGTRVFVYDTSDVLQGGNLHMISHFDINGCYLKAYAVGSDMHVVTTSSINYYEYFDRVFQRSQFSASLTDEDYIKRVQSEGNEIIPKFVDGMIEQLVVDGQLPDILRLSVMQMEWNTSHADALVYDFGINNAYVQVSSFDVASIVVEKLDCETPEFNYKGVFLPSFPKLYATSDALIIVVDGYDYMPASQAYNEFTYLLTMNFNGPSASFQAVGQVPGTLMNYYSMNVADSVLRIGTTVSQSGWRYGPWSPGSMTKEVVPVDPTPSSLFDVDSDSVTASYVSVGAVERIAELFINTLYDEDCTLALTTNPIPANTLPPNTNTWSLITNYLTMITMPDKNRDYAGKMMQLGQVKFGKDKKFTSIRFFDNIAYAVPHLQRDSLFTLDLSDPSNPQVLDELNITVTSDYLRSMNNDNTLLLNIGEVADEDGLVSEIQITVLDMRDRATPCIANQYKLENDDANSLFEGPWNFDTVSYSRELERLVVPIDINNIESPSKEFHGFYVFVVNVKEISLCCCISHSTHGRNSDACYFCTYLPNRSMVFDNTVTTMNGHYVNNTNLNTCTSVWELEIKPRDQNYEYCGWL